MPNAVLESMVLGVSPIVTELMGELVENNVTGLVVSYADTSALIAAIHRLICEPAPSAAIGNAARAHVLAHYQPQQEARKYCAVFEKVLRRRNGTEPR